MIFKPRNYHVYLYVCWLSCISGVYLRYLQTLGWKIFENTVFKYRRLTFCYKNIHFKLKGLIWERIRINWWIQMFECCHVLRQGTFHTCMEKFRNIWLKRWKVRLFEDKTHKSELESTYILFGQIDFSNGVPMALNCKLKVAWTLKFTVKPRKRFFIGRV